jgi:transcription initiation factor TFIIIB Brf1 subunit/transcription initiation factor TFIIB
MQHWDRINALRKLRQQSSDTGTNNIVPEPTEEELYKRDCTQIANESVSVSCPECLDGQIVSFMKSGYDGCNSCEYTTSIIIADDNEHRQYADSSNKSLNRCGLAANPMLPKSSMSTMIKMGGGLDRIKRIHQWDNMPHHERSLLKIFKEMDVLVRKSNLMGIIVTDAKYYYKILHDKDNHHVLTRGDVRKGAIAACYLYACNQRGIARTDVEIAYIFNISIKMMTRGCNKFQEIMWIKGHKIYFDIISPLLYIERFCNVANMKPCHIENGKFIAYRTYKLGLLRSNIPLSVSGGIMLLLVTIYEYEITKAEIIKICRTSDMTITKCFKILQKNLYRLLPKTEIDKITTETKSK